MKRRDFITLIGGAAVVVAWPLAGRTQQQTRKLLTIGFHGREHTCDPEPGDRGTCAAIARTGLEPVGGRMDLSRLPLRLMNPKWSAPC